MNSIKKFPYQELVTRKIAESFENNQEVMSVILEKVILLGQKRRFLFGFGSGHSALFPLELYHRAGGYSQFIPVVADYLMPQAGPHTVRALERSHQVANHLLAQYSPEVGEMIWIMSQSGINPAVVDFALHAKSIGLETVAFTNVNHSQAVPSRHSSGKRLYEVTDHVINLSGEIGDAGCLIQAPHLKAGPTSLVTSVALGHAILVEACRALEELGVKSTYTSVNTPTGEALNKELERFAALKDFRLKTL